MPELVQGGRLKFYCEYSLVGSNPTQCTILATVTIGGPYAIIGSCTRISAAIGSAAAFTVTRSIIVPPRPHIHIVPPRPSSSKPPQIAIWIKPAPSPTAPSPATPSTSPTTSKALHSSSPEQREQNHNK